MTPRKKLKALLLCMLTSIALTLAFSLPAIAGAEGGNLALQKNKKMNGFLIIEFVDTNPNCGTTPTALTCQVKLTFVGECVYNVGDQDVAFSIPIDYETTQNDFANTGPDDLIGRKLGGIGPTACFVAQDTLIITRVNEFYNGISDTGTLYIGAKVTIRALKP